MNKTAPLRNTILLTSFVLFGCYAMIAQIVFIREFLVVFYGNEICLGVIFTAWFVWIGIGAVLGAKSVDRLRAKWTALILLQIVASLIFPLQVTLIRGLRSFINVGAGELAPFAAVFFSTFLLLAPLSFIIGYRFPLGARVYALGRTEREKASQIGRIYVAESIGSIVGGMAFTFLLVYFFNHSQSILLLVSLLVLTTFLMALLSPDLRWRRGTVLLSGTLVIVSLLSLPFSSKLEQLTVKRRWAGFASGMEFLGSFDSRYQNIAIGVLSGQYTVFGNGKVAFSFPDKYGYAFLANLVLAEHPRAEEVLVIGGGVGGLLREMLKHPIEKLHYVELDPMMTDVIKKYLPDEDEAALDDPRVKVFHGDGRNFVKQVPTSPLVGGRYDLVLVEVPDPSTAMLNRFYTVEFFKELRNILKPAGVISLEITSAANYFGEEIGDYTSSIYRTLKEVFPYVVVAPGDTNYFFAALKPGIVTADFKALTSRFKERGVKTPYFNPHIYKSVFQPERVKFINRALEGKRDFKINQDLRPISYYFNLLLWNRYSGSRMENLFKKVEKVNSLWGILLIGAFLLIRFLYLALRRIGWKREQKFNVLSAVITTGFAGMALEIILIFTYQNIYGYVYERIGLITASFMIGLVAGALSMNRALRGVKLTASLANLASILGAIFIFSLGLPWLLKGFSGGVLSSWRGFSSEVVYMLIIVLAGFLTGFLFPLANKLYLECEESSGRAAGMVDCADHGGACLGAMLTGTLLVPLWGVENSCIAVAALAGTSLFLLAFQMLRRPTA